MKALALILALSLMPLALLRAAERVALIVGCNEYQVASMALDTPVNDALRMAELLKSKDLGFEVISAFDPSLKEFNRALVELKNRASAAKVVLLYFSGHGVEADGENYLLPVDAQLSEEADLRSETVAVGSVLKDLKASGADAKLLVLDCCRNNPFLASKAWHKTKDVRDQVLRELGEAEIPESTLVCFATGAGRKAAAVLDDTSSNSPFTESLVHHLQTPKANVLDVFAAVHDDLAAATGGRQLPSVKTDNAIAPVFRQLVLYKGVNSPPVAQIRAARPAKPEEVARQNAAPYAKLESPDQLIMGIKQFIRYKADALPGEEPSMGFEYATVKSSARLVFAAIPPNYPLALALKFPELRRACPLPASFYDGLQGILDTDGEQLLPGWVLQATIYDFDGDGNPEVVVAANKWDEATGHWDVSTAVRVLVFSFHAPAREADLDRAENWHLCGTMEGQYIVDLEEERLILPIGSRSGDDYVFRAGAFLAGGGVGRDLAGKWTETTSASRTQSVATKNTATVQPVGVSGNWRVVERALPKHGGYHIVWNYVARQEGDNVVLTGHKTEVDGNPPTRGESAAVSTVVIPASGLSSSAVVDEVNHKGGHLRSTWKITFDETMQSFSAKNYEGEELNSELTGSKQ